MRRREWNRAGGYVVEDEANKEEEGNSYFSPEENELVADSLGLVVFGFLLVPPLLLPASSRDVDEGRLEESAVHMAT